MAKIKTITSTEQLEAKRKKLIKKGPGLGFLISFIFFLLVALYCILAILGTAKDGHVTYALPFTDKALEFNLPAWMSWTSSLPYFDVAVFDIFEVSIEGKLNNDVLYRLIIVLGTILVCIILWISVALGVKAHNKKKYLSLYKETLGKLTAKEQNLLITGEKSTSLNKDLKDTILRAIDTQSLSTNTVYTLTVGEQQIKAYQLKYKTKARERNGFIIRSLLKSSASDSFLQFRTFGKLGIKEFQGSDIKKIGFANGEIADLFVLYSALGDTTSEVIDSKVLKAVVALKKYVNCGVVITLEKGELSVFLEGFSLKLLKNIKTPLQNNWLESQADALNELYDRFIEIASSLSLSSDEHGLFITYKDEKETAPKSVSLGEIIADEPAKQEEIKVEVEETTTLVPEEVEQPKVEETAQTEEK